jgi:uncharacterized protein YabN with tetrapyrrole methylase and pyrophosphatase domain
MKDQLFSDAIKATQQNIARFEKIEGKPWGVEGAVIELAKQVGQLSALVMNREGYYFSEREKLSSNYDSTNDNIADELVDIMFAVVRIASHYNINLVDASAEVRQSEDKFLKQKGV